MEYGTDVGNRSRRRTRASVDWINAAVFPVWWSFSPSRRCSDYCTETTRRRSSKKVFKAETFFCLCCVHQFPCESIWVYFGEKQVDTVLKMPKLPITRNLPWDSLKSLTSLKIFSIKNINQLKKNKEIVSEDLCTLCHSNCGGSCGWYGGKSHPHLSTYRGEN